jgi:hypothetical protein
MRSSQKPASLAELVGKDVKDLSFSDLPKILGEKMPEMPFNRIGRFRLTNALRMRFGPGFRNIPGVQNIIKDFDDNMSVENIVKINLEARNAKSN